DLHAPLVAAGTSPAAREDDVREVLVRIITKKDPEALGIMRHSAAHVMAQAVMRLHKGVGLAFGRTTATGCCYGCQVGKLRSEDDLPAIEAGMARIVAADERFERMIVPRAKALEMCRELGQKRKVEHIETGLADEETLSSYRQG